MCGYLSAEAGKAWGAPLPRAAKNRETRMGAHSLTKPLFKWRSWDRLLTLP